MIRNEGTSRTGGGFDEQDIQAVWEKAAVVTGLSTSGFRRDQCGALIQRKEYGDRNSTFGWEIDHILPVSRGGTDRIDNLQPLHWENNVAKGDSYPNWSCKVRC